MDRVLHVVATDRRRGAELFASALADRLGEAGVEQLVAVLRPASTGATVSFPATLASARDRGVSRVGLARAIRRWRPTVIQAHGGEALAAALPGSLGGPPVVYRRIGDAPARIAAGWRRAAFGAGVRRCARVVAVAEAIRRQTIELFRVRAGDVVTIPNAIDTVAVRRIDRGVARRGLGLPQAARVSVQVGALVAEKDPVGSLEAVSIAMIGRPDVRHLVVGEGPLRPAMEARARALGIDARVLFLGERGDVPAVLSAADVFVFGSPPGSMEGMPASVLEAAACGVPVIATRVGGLDEVVVPGKTGVLVPPNDHAQLSEAIGELLDDDALRAVLGAGASALADRFDIRDVSTRYLELYREVAS